MPRELSTDKEMTNKQLRDAIVYICYINRINRTWMEGKKKLVPSDAKKDELEKRLRILLARYEDII